MAGRMSNLGLLVIVALAVAATGSSAYAEQSPACDIEVHVDSVVASDTHEGLDTRLATMNRQLKALFSYSTYRLIGHQDGRTAVGKEVTFDLPGGRILHVKPREVAGDMIAMDLVLFQGARPLMTTYLKLRDHGVLILGGPRYEQGMLMLIVSISAQTLNAAPPPAQATSTAPASAAAH